MTRPFNYLYLYDLDPASATVKGICDLVKNATKIVLTDQPQIWRSLDSTRYFWTACVKFDSPEKLELAAKTLRHYKYGGVPIRALPYMTELKGENANKLSD